MVWLLLVVSSVFSMNGAATRGITSVGFERFIVEQDCKNAAADIYRMVKNLGYDPPEKYVQVSCTRVHVLGKDSPAR